MVTGIERETENYVQRHCIVFLLGKKKENYHGIRRQFKKLK